jgi:enamine deaminase RidA (YjgF/YER057c/UK114 family)
MSVYDGLAALNISLPPISAPVAAYSPCARTGNLLFSAGHIARKDGKPWVGQLGVDIAIDQGTPAARAVAIDLLGTLHAAVGDLNHVRRTVKLLVLVNSSPTFTASGNRAPAWDAGVSCTFTSSGSRDPKESRSAAT